MHGKHQCPVAGCPETIRSDMSICTKHWLRVPLHLKLDLIKAREAGLLKYPKLLAKAVRIIERKVGK